LFQCGNVYSLSTDNILVWIWEIQLVFIMDVTSFMKILKISSLFKTHIENVCKDVFSKIVLRALIRNQHNNASGHLIGLSR
jgi:hypothetical protein